MDLLQFDSRSAGQLLAGAERFERLAARTDLNQGLRDSSLASLQTKRVGEPQGDDRAEGVHVPWDLSAAS